MQRTRRRARYEAWHDGRTGTSSFNPFANTRTARRPERFADEESPELTVIRTNGQSVNRRQEEPASADEISEEPTQKYSNINHEPSHAGIPPMDDGDNGSSDGVDIVRSDDKASVSQNLEIVFKTRKAESRMFPEEVVEVADMEHTTKSSTKKPKQMFPIYSQLRAVFFNSWAHLLLLLIPAGFAVQYTHRNSVTVFCVNFVAMLPSIMVLSFAVDEIGMRLGETFGGLVSTTFNNAAQLITSILLLKSRQIAVLQISLLGAILSNLLLMPGLSFFFGGLHRVEQHFNVTLAQCISTMLLLAVLALTVPSAAQVLTRTSAKGILQQSRGIAVVLLIAYGWSLYFQLGTHAAMWNSPGEKVPPRKTKVERGETARGLAKIGAESAAASGGQIAQSQIYRAYEEEEEDERDEPQLSFGTAVGTLMMFTTLLTFNTLFATDSINGLLQHVGISETFLGLVILPLLGNDPTTLIVAIKDKLDLTLALTLWKGVQIALLVIPFIVILGWIMDVDNMTLNFGSFEILVLFASILVVNYIVQDGKSNWLVGALLVAVYVIIAIAAFFVP